MLVDSEINMITKTRVLVPSNLRPDAAPLGIRLTKSMVFDLFTIIVKQFLTFYTLL